MIYSFLHLNWLAVLGTTVIGFLLGWLWYSPLMFATPWKREMGLTDADLAAIAAKGMASYLIRGFVYTLIGTIALATLLREHIPVNVVRGAEYGGFIGAFVVGARMLNTGVWEGRSMTLQAIKIAYEIVLFAVQGAVLTLWW